MIDKHYFEKKFIIALLIIGITVYFGGTDKLDGDNIMVLLGLVGAGYGFSDFFDKKYQSTDNSSN